VVAADRDLTVLRTERAFEAVGTVDGRLRWRRPAPRIEYPSDLLPGAVTRDAVVVQPRYEVVLGLDRSTGRLRWLGPTPTGQVLAMGQIVLSTTTFGKTSMTAHGGLVAIDSRTGARLWRRSVDRGAVALAAAPRGRVLVLDGDMVPHSTD
jgi:outer membrane protein assembly factor BamB